MKARCSEFVEFLPCLPVWLLGHNNKAVHRTYAKRAQVLLPTLEDYEKRHESHALPKM